mmetsp:Transcript_18868/g.44498  ORF Transcript_18868/g.44498 Transcript_18868/m.44498 type:complete len:200 (-) Transcript_18868:92-691(-)
MAGTVQLGSRNGGGTRRIRMMANRMWGPGGVAQSGRRAARPMVIQAKAPVPGRKAAAAGGGGGGESPGTFPHSGSAPRLSLGLHSTGLSHSSGLPRASHGLPASTPGLHVSSPGLARFFDLSPALGRSPGLSPGLSQSGFVLGSLPGISTLGPSQSPTACTSGGSGGGGDEIRVAVTSSRLGCNCLSLAVAPNLGSCAD